MVARRAKRLYRLMAKAKGVMLRVFWSAHYGGGVLHEIMGEKRDRKEKGGKA